MKRTGNVVSNQVYNPTNVKASIPLDVDEVNLAIERYIRQKYEYHSLQEGGSRTDPRQHTGSSSTTDPPPPPPKPQQRLGLLPELSSRFTLADPEPNESPAIASLEANFRQPRAVPAAQSNKPSRILGAPVGDTSESLENKLTRLKQMGFPDESRNDMILISSNGSLETSVESMLTTGERNPPLAALPVPSTTNPDLSGLQGRSASMSAIERSSSNNPFSATTTRSGQGPIADALQRKTPLNGHPGESQVPGAAGQSCGSVFYPPTLQPSSSQLVTGGLSTSGPLLPNATGFNPAHQQDFIMQRHAQTPPFPFVSPFYDSTDLSDVFSPQTDNGNPFVVSPPQSWVSPAAPQQSLYDRTNSFPRPSPEPVCIGLIQPPSLVLNQIGKQVDKSAIMALFNSPLLAPSSELGGGPFCSEMQPRNLSSPVGPRAGTRNPFSSTNAHASGTGSSTVGTTEPSRHVSQDSMNLTNGRYSPELFSSLSARSVRPAR